ncbi:hypothetical protein MUO65_03230 [bacterium]|nr:hypothetical protein [bacterium]
MEQTTTQSMLKVSDWVMILTALFLGACALFVPFLAELIKRKLFAPRLTIKFSQVHPYCHLTKRVDGSTVYYFRFRVLNEGGSQARLCEALLEELWLADSAGNFIQEENFSPVNLTWVGEYVQSGPYLIPKQFININPKRKVFCDIGHISNPDFQRDVEKSQFYLERDSQELKFFFDSTVKFFAQRDCVSRGKAKIKISIYSENASKCERNFLIAWSGNWKDREEDMFREIVIS